MHESELLYTLWAQLKAHSSTVRCKASRKGEDKMNKDMVDSKKDIMVWNGSSLIGTISAGNTGLTPSPKLQLETLKARGDARLCFSKMIYFEPKAGCSGWDVKIGDSLTVPASTQKRLTAKL